MVLKVCVKNLSCFYLSQVYGGVHSEDKQWYRCCVKKLVEEDKVPIMILFVTNFGCSVLLF